MTQNKLKFQTPK